MEKDIICFYHQFGLVIGERIGESVTGDSVTMKKPCVAIFNDGKMTLHSLTNMLATDELIFIFDEMKFSSKGDLLPSDELKKFYLEFAFPEVEDGKFKELH